MALETFDLEVYIEGADPEKPIEVKADQRDLAKFEKEYGMGVFEAKTKAPLTLFRFAAYAALKRKGQLEDPNITREAWLDTVLQVDMVDDEDDAPLPLGSPAAGPTT